MNEKVVHIQLSMNKKMGEDLIEAIKQAVGYNHNSKVDWEEFGYGDNICPVYFYLDEIEEAIKEAFKEEN